MVKHVLILGGTTEARELAARLEAVPGLAVTLSLAGRTREPAPQAGRLRIGGFGGADGLGRYLMEAAIDVLVDATHPFADRISANAVLASQSAGVPMVVLERPAWEKAEGDRWIEVADMADAVRSIGDAPRVVFLAIGRQEAGAFLAAPQHRYVIRSIEPLEVELSGAETILARGPFAEADEVALLQSRGVEIVVAKNSGGAATNGKIAAARKLGLPVVMVRRPEATGAEVVRTLKEAVAKVLDLSGHQITVPPAERGE